MKQSIDFNDFERAFEYAGRENQFSRAGLGVLFDYLEEYERDLEPTREMSNILADYGLLEAFTLQATLRDGDPLNLAGMYRVVEERLDALNAAQLRNLMKKGILGRVYAHLLSIEGFGRLLARKAGTLGAPA